MLILCWKDQFVFTMDLVIHHCSLGCVSIFIKKLYSIYILEAKLHSELKLNVQSLHPNTVFCSIQGMEVLWLWKLEVYKKIYMTPTKESHQFQFLVHQDSSHYLERKLGCGREYSLLWHSAGGSGCLGFIFGYNIWSSGVERAWILESPGTG